MKQNLECTYSDSREPQSWKRTVSVKNNRLEICLSRPQRDKGFSRDCGGFWIPSRRRRDRAPIPLGLKEPQSMDTSWTSKECRQSLCAVQQHTQEPGASRRETESRLGKGTAACSAHTKRTGSGGKPVYSVLVNSTSAFQEFLRGQSKSGHISWVKAGRSSVKAGHGSRAATCPGLPVARFPVLPLSLSLRSDSEEQPR